MVVPGMAGRERGIRGRSGCRDAGPGSRGRFSRRRRAGRLVQQRAGLSVFGFRLLDVLLLDRLQKGPGLGLDAAFAPVVQRAALGVLANTLPGRGGIRHGGTLSAGSNKTGESRESTSIARSARKSSRVGGRRGRRVPRCMPGASRQKAKHPASRDAGRGSSGQGQSGRTARARSVASGRSAQGLDADGPLEGGLVHRGGRDGDENGVQ
jgi:hypothetical protein